VRKIQAILAEKNRTEAREVMETGIELPEDQYSGRRIMIPGKLESAMCESGHKTWGAVDKIYGKTKIFKAGH